MSTTPATPIPLSDEYPKWLRKSGARDVQVKSREEEEAKRGDGFSHEVIVDEQQPPLGSVQPTAVLKQASAAGSPNPMAGTVATAVLDEMLENQRKRFDASWKQKCEELTQTKADLKTLQDIYDKLLLSKTTAPVADAPAPAADPKPAVVPKPVKPPVAG